MLSYKRIILVGLGLFCMGSFAGDAAIDSLTEGEFKEMRERYKTLQNKAIVGDASDLKQFLKYHNLVVEEIRRESNGSRRYAPRLDRAYKNLETISKGKDYFADSIEARSKDMVKIAEKLREIKNKHAALIARGEYIEYLEVMSGFLAGLKGAYPDPIDEELIQVNMLRGIVAGDKFGVNKKFDVDGDMDVK